MPRIHATLKKILLAISILLIFAIFYLLIFINFYFKNAIKSAGEGRIIFYNRIPKTGSTTFTNAIAYDLCAQNGFHVAHLNLTKNRFQMGKIDQAQLVRNLTGWTRMHPLFLHGHIAFVNFQSFGLPRPIWINLLREPFDRFVSHYYFLRFGDNFRVGLKRSKAGNNETFDECFLRGAKECHPNASWLQIPYFCGTAHFCSEPGNPMALEMAKRNLIGEYLLVGVMERMEQMIEMLEQMLPEFFRGAISHFRSLDEKRAHLRHTIRKVEPSEEVRRKFTANPVFQMEKEFYEFALAEFDSTWRRATLASKNAGNGGGELLEGRRQFHFEKIRP